MKARFGYLDARGVEHRSMLTAADESELAAMLGAPDHMVGRTWLSLECDFGRGYRPVSLSEFYSWISQSS